MRVHSKRFRILIGVVFIVCLVGGAIVGVTLAFQSTYSSSATNQKHTNPLNYPENKYGQTYGSAEEANFLKMLPDLIHVGSVDGIKGYVLKKDYLSELSRDVPLYDVDGITIIGTFHIPAKNMNYPKNKNGQTYGSATDASSYEKEPDLISAFGVDGTVGYVLKKDLEGEMPKSPEEAIAIQNSSSPNGRDIPLYDVDGETVIGVFHIEGNNAKEIR